MDNKTSELSLDLLRAGDRAEISRLVDLFSTPIYRLALKVTGNSQDAEDILQTTFLKAIQSLKGFEGRSTLSTWLYRIAANEALMILRRRRPEVSIDVEPDDPTSGPVEPIELADWGSLPEKQLLTNESRNYLDQAVQNLPENLRLVFLLRDVEGLSIKETGEILGLTETNVKTRLLRARLNLREQLSSYFAEHMLEGKKNDKA